VQQMEADRHFGQSSRQVANTIGASIEYVYTRYEVFTSVYMKTTALWIVWPCILRERTQFCQETCCLILNNLIFYSNSRGGRLLLNVGYLSTGLNGVTSQKRLFCWQKTKFPIFCAFVTNLTLRLI
jgi:hypothetical protein